MRFRSLTKAETTNSKNKVISFPEDPPKQVSGVDLISHPTRLLLMEEVLHQVYNIGSFFHYNIYPPSSFNTSENLSVSL